jgi:nitroreductase
MTSAPTTSTRLHAILAERWSPRSFDATVVVDDGQIRALLEAARWSPSGGNSQPWRFVVTRRGDEAFTRLLATLRPTNQAWAGDAGLLVLALAELHHEDGSPRRHAFYDVGQAVAHLSAQAGAEGLHVRQMGGFDGAAAADAFAVPAGIEPVVVVAVGRAAATAEIPERTRLTVDDIVLPPGLPA